jgi:DNA-binding response OmpR family regulator
MRVLVVDDEPEVLDLVGRALKRDGHAIRTAGSLDGARAELDEARPEVIVLDMALGDGSGLELCKELRLRDERIPILLLTAHGEVPKRLAGFEAGADDFLAKPFSVAELRARVRALGRRGPIGRPAVVQLLKVTLDLAGRRALSGGREVPLTAREWAVVELLAARSGRVVSRGEILDGVWGENTEAASASLDVMIGRIRRKLGADVVRTLRGEGYALRQE